MDLSNCKNLSDIARQEFGKTNSNAREKVKKLLEEEGIDWKQWLTEQNIKIKEAKARYCLYCGKELSPSQDKYCSSNCQHAQQQKEYIDRWKAGLENGLKGEYQLSKHIRNYLLVKHDYKCELCGWGEKNPYTDTIPLEIHHKDGNYLNNKEENLQVLCPNCHSLTETHKSHNKEGRKGRKKYYKDEEE